MAEKHECGWEPLNVRVCTLKPSFTPLDSKVLNAVAAAAGISLDRSVGFSLQFREPGLVVAVVEYHVPADAFAAAVGAISSLPEAKQ